MSEFSQSLADTFLNQAFYLSFAISLFRLLAGFAISIGLSCFFVYLGMKFKAVEKMVRWIVAFAQPIPKIVLFPLLLVFFGLNDFSKILLIAIGLFFTSFLILYSAVRNLIEDRSFKIVRMFNVSKTKVSYYYYFKGLKSAIETVFRNAIGYGLTLVVVSESNFATNGIGYLIWSFWERYELVALGLTVLAVSLTAVFLNFLITLSFKKI